MNKKLNFCMLLLAATLTFFISSCKDEKHYSYMPTWKGFVYSPRPIVLGDSVTIVAQQAEHGKLIYKAVYNWTATYHILRSDGSDSTVVEKKSNTVVYDNNPADPTVRFHVPGNISSRFFTVTFQGEYHYSATGVQGSDGSIAAEGTSGTLHRGQSSTLYGYSNGTLQLQVPNN